MSQKIPTIGSAAMVYHGNAVRTSGGLVKSDLMKNKYGLIVSKKKHAHGKRMFSRNRAMMAAPYTKGGKRSTSGRRSSKCRSVKSGKYSSCKRRGTVQSAGSHRRRSHSTRRRSRSVRRSTRSRSRSARRRSRSTRRKSSGGGKRKTSHRKLSVKRRKSSMNRRRKMTRRSRSRSASRSRSRSRSRSARKTGGRRRR